jgi:Histidine kinase-, DNA gyrase B-, and HSP90-like ATPase
MITARGPESLAGKIRATGKTREPVVTAIKTDQRVLARITDGIYRQPSSALRELISNAYDADATEVVILTDAPRFSVISVRDDGIGLSPESLQHLIEHIGGSAKRTGEGAALHITAGNDATRSPGGRQLIGKLGIGLFSVAQFTRHFLLITKTSGERFRTLADITLGSQADGPTAANSELPNEITTGHARIWTERAADAQSHGTEVKLLDLLPRTRAELASFDLWAKIDFERDTEGKELTRPPYFHIGRARSDDPDNLLLQPQLPWKSKDKPRAKFEKLVKAVRDLATINNDLVDLESVCDRYLQTIWSIALAAPLRYLDKHPFDLTSNDGLDFYVLENRTRGQARDLSLGGSASPRRALGLTAPSMLNGDRFEVSIDGIELSRPILFRDQPTTENAVKTPLLFLGQCREDFEGKPFALSGGPLDFEAYLFWTPKVIPTQHQGVMIRVGNASGAPFDKTFMGYQISEQTRLRQITSEIFVREGLEGAINLDRESFNYAHPHYQFLVKWLHSSLRQLANKHKEVGASIRTARLKQSAAKAHKRLERVVSHSLTERGVEDLPVVELLEEDQARDARTKRNRGIVALDKSRVMPESTAARQTEAEGQRTAFIERKAVAITQILKAWGLLDRLSFADQEQLVHDILEVVTAEADE